MSATTSRDQLIADAKSLPDLIATATVADPALAKALTGQAQQASATPAGSVVAFLLTAVVTRYGLGWSPEFVGLVSGLAVLAGGYLVHWYQSRRAKAILATPPVAPAA